MQIIIIINFLHTISVITIFGCHFITKKKMFKHKIRNYVCILLKVTNHGHVLSLTLVDPAEYPEHRAYQH